MNSNCVNNHSGPIWEGSGWSIQLMVSILYGTGNYSLAIVVVTIIIIIVFEESVS